MYSRFDLGISARLSVSRVAVIGSKPGARIPDADVYFFANGALGTFGGSLDSERPVVSVISQQILHLTPSNDSEDAHIRETARLIRSASADTTVVICSFPFVPDPHLRYSRLLTMSRRDMRRLARDVAGNAYGFRVFVGRLRHCDVMSILRVVKALGQIRRSEYADFPPFMRPSTGIIALLIAVRCFGHQVDYFIGGIGTTARNVYAHGIENYPGSSATHSAVDVLIVGRLARRYRLATTSAELSEACGISLVEGT